MPYYGDAYRQWGRGLGYEPQRFLNDLEKVMLYFTDFDCRESSLGNICDHHIRQGNTRKIETRYFYISVFKKGTMHIQFRDEDLLRRFNIEACKQKGFLPMDYGESDFDVLNHEQQAIVEHFEGKSGYQPIRHNVPLLKANRLPTLAYTRSAA